MYDTQVWTKHYDQGVPEAVQYQGQLIHQTLDAAAAKYPNKVALRMVLRYLPLGITIQSKMAYHELVDATNRFAAALQNMGVKPGDRVSVMLPNLPQQVIAFFGILKAGAVVVNTNPTYTAREIQHQLSHSGAETIVMLSSLYSRLQEVKDRTPIKRVIIADVGDTLGFPFKSLVEKQVRASGLMVDLPAASGLFRFGELLASSAAKAPAINAKPDDMVVLQYTGGTTDVPKAAMLSHANLITNVLQLQAWMPDLERGGEKTLGSIPFFHVYGMTVAMLFTLHSGGELIVTPDPRRTELILEIIHREKVSLYPGIPTMYSAIINHPRVTDFDLRSVKACMSGGMALPVEIQRRFEEITGGKLIEGYGLTETSPALCANPLDGVRKPGSIGMPIPSTYIEVVSLDQREDGGYDRVAVGAEGELIAKGPQVMAGYWNAKDETSKSIDSDGWFHTGDIARMDADGCFYIVDRKKDVIIASGFNIVPREVEEVLYMHPKVQDAVVAGLPDPRRGETVKAYVVLKAGESCSVEEIRDFCKENLAPYKVPVYVDFRDDLPKSQVGKFLRRVLKEEEMAKQSE